MVARKKATSSSQSSASRPAAYTKPLQKLVDETRSFGRVPKQKKGDSAPNRYERNLYMRLYRQKVAARNKATSSSQCTASRPAAYTKPLQKLVDEIRSFGRLPKWNMGASPDDQFEYNLYQRYLRHQDKLPENLLQDKADALDVFNFQLLLEFALLSLC